MERLRPRTPPGFAPALSAIHDAVFRQLGVEPRHGDPEDLIEFAYACTRGRLPRSRRLAAMTVSAEPVIATWAATAPADG